MTAERDLHLLTAGYALDSLDEAERDRFENYLTQSDEARTEVAEMADTALLLGLASRPVTPSPELKTSLMALIAATPQLAPGDQADATAERSPAAQQSGSMRDIDRAPSEEQQQVIRSLGAGAEGSSRAETTAAPIPTTRAEARAVDRWYRKPVNAVLAVAAAVALIAGGAFLGSGLGSGDDFQQAQADGFAELITADDVVETVTPVAGGGEATLLRSDDLQRSAVAIDGLPELDGDRTYQLWYIDDDGATSAGTVDAQSGVTWRVLDGTAADDAAVGMTIEPKGGSAAPTTDPIVVVAA